MAYLIAFIVLILILVFTFSSKKVFFGLILSGSSIYIAINIMLLLKPYLGFLDKLFGIIAILIVIIASVIISMYTLLFGKYINIFVASVMWIAVYFSYMDIGIKFVLSFEYMDMDIQFIDIGFIENLVIYFTVTGIASLFVWNLSYADSFSE